MNDTEIGQRLLASYDDIALRDPLAEVMVRGSRVRRARRRRMAAAVAAVGVLAVVSTTVATSGPGGSGVVVAQAVRLVAFAAPSSPVSLQPLPLGLTPAVDLDNGTATVLYLESTSAAAVSLRARSEAPAADVGDRAVSVGTTPGRVRTGVQDRNVPRATLTWERRPGQWVSLTGIGPYGTPEALLTLAATVADGPVQLTTRITLAPEGWVVTSYKDVGPTGGVLTLSDPADNGRNLTIIGSDQAPPPVDQGTLMDPGPLTTVQVQGREATLVQGRTTWYLSAVLGTGSIVLQAPVELTSDQVVQIADTAALP